MSTPRLELARAFSHEVRQTDPHITAAFVTGSAARDDGGELSDIDIRFIAAPQAATGAAHILCQGLYLDAIGP